MLDCRAFRVFFACALIWASLGCQADAQFKRRFSREPIDFTPTSDGLLHGGAFQEDRVDPHQYQWHASKRFDGSTHSTRFAGSLKQSRTNLKATVSLMTAEAKQVLYKGFLRMNCQEFTELSANYLNADRNYKYLGRKYAAPANKSGIAPETSLEMRGATFTVRLSLPGLKKPAVFLYSDNKHLLAIEPDSYETWVSQPAAGSKHNGWKKLTHIKK